jgi:hypothetical protein
LLAKVSACLCRCPSRGLHPTIAALAAALERKERGKSTATMVDALPSVVRPAEGILETCTRSLEETRALLRDMMTAPAKPEPTPLEAYQHLRKAQHPRFKARF